MNEQEKKYTKIALEKWVDGEPLSIFDFRRILNLFKTQQLGIAQASQDELAALKAEFVATIRSLVD